MLLAIDIGNTNIHFGLWDGAVWVQTWRARTIAGKMADEYAVLLRSFFAEQDLSFGDVSDDVGSFRLRDLKYAAGSGVRFQINPEQKINLRVDFAVGEVNSHLYVNVMEAFWCVKWVSLLNQIN